MKVAIFGDSFGEDKMMKYTYPGWPTFLKEKYKIEIDNYALSGSSMFFSYRNFLKYYNDYDKIIFIATSAYRFEIPGHIRFRKGNEYVRHINGPQTIDQWLSQPHLLEKMDTEALTAAKLYYDYLYDSEKEEIIRDLIKKDVANRRKDAIIIDAFSNDPSEVSLFSISKMEVLSQGLPDQLLHSDDCRTCHLSIENNKILADKMYEFLTGQPVILRIEDFITPTEDMRLYFK